MPWDAVICDIDGCLSPESSTPMDADALARIAAFNRRAGEAGGPALTVCSGRPQPFAEAMCRLLGNTTLPCVAENGVWLYHPSDNRYDMDPSITREHMSAVRSATEWIETQLGPKGVAIQPGKTASISLYHADTEYLRQTVCPLVETAFRACGWPFRVSMTWLYINCDLEHVSKASGLDRVAAATGLKKERMAGIGDTTSDIAIADRVAFFACPANADERIKARAHYVSPFAEARGVLDILEHLPR